MKREGTEGAQEGGSGTVVVGPGGSSELRGLEGMVCRVIRGSSKLVGLVVTGTGTDRLVDGRWGLGRELGKLHGAGNWLGKLGAEL